MSGKHIKVEHLALAREKARSHAGNGKRLGWNGGIYRAERGALRIRMLMH